MAKTPGIGAQDEKGNSRMWYYVWLIFIAAYMAWSYIGVSTQDQRNLLTFYMIFLYTPALILILADNITKGDKIKWIDTVTIEKTPVNPKWILVGGIAFAVFIAWTIFTPNAQGAYSAFVNYPQFSFVIFASLPIFAAITSGVCGAIENMFFFSTIFPTLLAVFDIKWNNKFLAGIVSGIITALGFFIFHFFRYGSMETAFISTLIFATINISMTYGLKSIIVSDLFHVTNNVAASIVAAGVALLFF